MTLLKKALAAALVCGVAWGAVGQAAEKPAVAFELRSAESQPAKGLTEATVEGTKHKVYLHKEAALTNQDVAEARATTDAGGKPAIEITFTEGGQKKIAKLTGDHVGKPLAIILAGKVVSAPIVRDEITGNKVVVSGDFTKEEAAKIAKGINGK